MGIISRKVSESCDRCKWADLANTTQLQVCLKLNFFLFYLQAMRKVVNVKGISEVHHSQEKYNYILSLQSQQISFFWISDDMSKNLVLQLKYIFPVNSPILIKAESVLLV